MKENRKLHEALWADLETDQERFDFLIAGRGFETGIMAKAVQNEVAMAFQFRAEIIKERMEMEAAPEDPWECIWCKQYNLSGGNCERCGNKRSPGPARL